MLHVYSSMKTPCEPSISSILKSGPSMLWVANALGVWRAHHRTMRYEGRWDERLRCGNCKEKNIRMTWIESHSCWAKMNIYTNAGGEDTRSLSRFLSPPHLCYVWEQRRDRREWWVSFFRSRSIDSFLFHLISCFSLISSISNRRGCSLVHDRCSQMAEARVCFSFFIHVFFWYLMSVRFISPWRWFAIVNSLLRWRFAMLILESWCQDSCLGFICGEWILTIIFMHELLDSLVEWW